MSRTEVRYALCDGRHIAYTRVGDAEPVLVLATSWMNHCELIWEAPPVARFLARLASFGSLIVYDRRGCGLSDPVPAAELTLDALARDVGAVLDGERVDAATVMGVMQAAAPMVHFAALQPDRVRSLIVYNGTVCARSQPGYEIGLPDAAIRFYLEMAENGWGRSQMAAPFVDPIVKEWWQRFQRNAVPLGVVQEQFSAFADLDAREALTGVTAPALVLHRVDNPVIPVAHGRYIADRIADSRFVELPGNEVGFFFHENDPINDELEEFLTGVRRGPADRILATVVFTDLVASTEHANAIGDRRWHDAMDAHDSMVRTAVARHGGREIKHTGDGFLLTFDNPRHAVECGLAISEAAASFDLPVRIAAHIGEIELRGDDVAGLAVVIAARVLAHAGAGDVLVTSTLHEVLVGTPFGFDTRDEQQLKGVPGTWRLYALNGAEV